MFVYTIINILIVLLAYIMYNLHLKKANLNKQEDYTNSLFFTISVVIILVFITGLRGQFTVDYEIYYNIFSKIKSLTLIQILQGNINVEIGYAVINKFVSFIFEDCVYLMIIIAFLTVMAYMKTFRKYSKSVWISVILLLCIGSYYTSFNTTRIALAAALIFLSSTFLYEKKDRWKYIICVLLISTIHKSALIMLLFYFLLQFKTFDKKNKNLVICLVPCFIILVIFGNQIINVLASIFYPSYLDEGYGMSWGNSIVTLARPIAVIVFLIINRKYLDLNDKKELVWTNGAILFLLISILSCNIRILYRFYYYVLPFVLLIIPNVIVKMPKQKKRNWIILIVICAMGYLLISNILNKEPYYFIWQYKLYDY